MKTKTKDAIKMAILAMGVAADLATEAQDADLVWGFNTTKRTLEALLTEKELDKLNEATD